jgi:hypothetical protein
MGASLLQASSINMIVDFTVIMMPNGSVQGTLCAAVILGDVLSGLAGLLFTEA